MGTPTVPFDVLARGYKLHGGQDGIRANVPFLVNWSDAFSFHDQVLGYPYAPVVGGPIVYTLPWLFPGAPNARLYATECEIEPIGADGLPLAANYGLAAGEFFSHAICNVTFQNRMWAQQPEDDPGNLQQLDPDKPLYFVEQRVTGGGKMVSIKGGTNYLWSDDSKPVAGDQGVLVPECRITLTWPWIPYLPWQIVQPYIGSINLSAMCGCEAETLLLENFDTKNKPTTQGIMGQELTLEFAWQSYSWNKVPKQGTPVLVKRADGSTDTDGQPLRIYKRRELTDLFF